LFKKYIIKDKMDEADGIKLSDKTRDYLQRKMSDVLGQIQKLKRKRKIVKIMYYLSVTLSVSTSAIIATISTLATLRTPVIPILSTISAVLTALSAKFNLQSKKEELNKLIERLNKLQSKLDYVVSCNGDLTTQTYHQILSEFN
jgi:methyl-accepting chemotaxis protein